MFNYTAFGYKTMPVGSMEEAKSSPIDLSGNPVFYFNRTNNEIYLKQFDASTGGAFFGRYKFVETPEEKTKKDDMKLINEKLDYLYSMLDEILKKEPKTESKTKEKENKKAVKDDE